MALASTHTDFRYQVSQRARTINLPQRLGTILWAPMLALGLMALPAAITLSAIRAHLIDQSIRPAVVAALGEGAAAATVLGLATMFAAVGFAVARILGVLRTGGGSIQEASGRTVRTLTMQVTARIFLGLMAMAMMILLFATAAHAILADTIYNAIANGDQTTITRVQRWGTWLGGLRPVGIVTYLLSISFGLATIVQVLRFQAHRIRELPSEHES
jgi:hypothetical protein